MCIRDRYDKEQVIDPKEIIDLTEFVDSKGNLKWKAPLGNWTIIRLGHTSTGRKNCAAPDTGVGLECDKFSKQAIQLHFNKMMDLLYPLIKPYVHQIQIGLEIDSWEVGMQNWTSGFEEEFYERAGYDLIKYLPAMTGKIVGSKDLTERFLWDIRRVQADLLADNYYGCLLYTSRWSWCDALFMAPPVYGQLNKLYPEKNYLDFMDREFKEATDSLYDKDAKLYYRDRRYIPRKEKNGEKVFWGRGNGWVFAGIPLLLQTLPKDHPTYNYYLNIYKEMASAVIKCQDKKGSWHASMLDPDSYPSPENSASGFFVYGLGWGVNQGILKDKKYKKAVQKGWKACLLYTSRCV